MMFYIDFFFSFFFSILKLMFLLLLNIIYYYCYFWYSLITVLVNQFKEESFGIVIHVCLLKMIYLFEILGIVKLFIFFGNLIYMVILEFYLVFIDLHTLFSSYIIIIIAEDLKVYRRVLIGLPNDFYNLYLYLVNLLIILKPVLYSLVYNDYIIFIWNFIEYNFYMQFGININNIMLFIFNAATIIYLILIEIVEIIYAIITILGYKLYEIILFNIDEQINFLNNLYFDFYIIQQVYDFALKLIIPFYNFVVNYKITFYFFINIITSFFIKLKLFIYTNSIFIFFKLDDIMINTCLYLYSCVELYCNIIFNFLVYYTKIFLYYLKQNAEINLVIMNIKQYFNSFHYWTEVLILIDYIIDQNNIKYLLNKVNYNLILLLITITSKFNSIIIHILLSIKLLLSYVHYYWNNLDNFFYLLTDLDYIGPLILKAWLNFYDEILFIINFLFFIFYKLMQFLIEYDFFSLKELYINLDNSYYTTLNYIDMCRSSILIWLNVIVDFKLDGMHSSVYIILQGFITEIYNTLIPLNNLIRCFIEDIVKTILNDYTSVDTNVDINTYIDLYFFIVKLINQLFFDIINNNEYWFIINKYFTINNIILLFIDIITYFVETLSNYDIFTGALSILIFYLFELLNYVIHIVIYLALVQINLFFGWSPNISMWSIEFFENSFILWFCFSIIVEMEYLILILLFIKFIYTVCKKFFKFIWKLFCSYLYKNDD